MASMKAQQTEPGDPHHQDLQRGHELGSGSDVAVVAQQIWDAWMEKFHWEETLREHVRLHEMHWQSQNGWGLCSAIMGSESPTPNDYASHRVSSSAIDRPEGNKEEESVSEC